MKFLSLTLLQQRDEIIPLPKSFLTRMKRKIIILLRSFQLMFIFAPIFLLFPLVYISKRSYEIWLSVLVSCLERGGAVWIKAAQYMSHRRDLIGESLADRLIHLREKAPCHSFKETEACFKLQFKKNVHEIFENFDEIPIASGSIAQVYKARLHDQDVAVKVRHPKVLKTVDNDLSIIFTVCRVAAKLFGILELPVTLNEFKKVLIDQTDFRKEADNLEFFNERFKNLRQIAFPKLIKV